MSDDARLIASARSGDGAAFGELVKRYQRRVYAAALHITGNHSDADDVAQEAFVKAYRHLGMFDGRSEIFTWLYRITVNAALNHLRSQKRVHRLVHSAEADRDGGAPAPEDATQRTPREWLEIGQQFREVIARVCELSAVLRVTLILAAVEQLPYRQIAEIMEVSEGTVAWRVSEARRQLRDRVALAVELDEEIA
jgi:RNA polymerase sigma-70 factor (ECF subfamily)